MPSQLWETSINVVTHLKFYSYLQQVYSAIHLCFNVIDPEELTASCKSPFCVHNSNLHGWKSVCLGLRLLTLKLCLAWADSDST